MIINYLIDEARKQIITSSNVNFKYICLYVNIFLVLNVPDVINLKQDSIVDDQDLHSKICQIISRKILFSNFKNCDKMSLGNELKKLVSLVNLLIPQKTSRVMCI